MQRTSSPISKERSPGSSSAGALAGWLVLAGIQIAVAFSLAGREDADGEPLYDYDLAIGSLVIYGLLIGLTFAIATAYAEPREALGFRRFPLRWVWITFGIVILSLVVSASLEPVLHASREQGLAPEDWRPERATAFFVNAAVIVTVVPFGEELFFRGLGVRALELLGGSGAVIGTALAFGLAHGILVALPPLFFFGLGLAWVRLRSDSVWPPILAHAAYNGVAIAAAFAAA